MQKYINNVAIKNGARVLTPLVGGLVTVTAIDGSPVDIFDANGGLPRTSDLLTDINGAFSFYAADGRYTITITGAGIVPITISDVLIEDPEDGSSASINGGSITNVALTNITIDGLPPVSQSVIAGIAANMSTNKINVDEDYTLQAGFNGMSAGPITVAPGITVTVSPGSTWSIL